MPVVKRGTLLFSLVGLHTARAAEVSDALARYFFDQLKLYGNPKSGSSLLIQG